MPRKRKINVPMAIAEEADENEAPGKTLSDFLRLPQAKKLVEIVTEAQKNDSYHEKCTKQVSS